MRKKMFGLSFKWKIILVMILMACVFVSLQGLSISKINGLKTSIKIDEMSARLNKSQVAIYQVYESLLFLTLNASSGSGMDSEEAKNKLIFLSKKRKGLDKLMKETPKDLAKSYIVFNKSADEVIKLLKEDSALDAAELSLTTLPMNFDKIAKQINAAITKGLDDTKNNSQNLLKSINKFNLLIAVACIAVFVIFMLVAYFSTSALLSPIEDAKEKLASLSQVLLNSANRMKESSLKIDDGSQSTASAIEENVSSVHEITQMVEQNLESVKKTNTLSNQASSVAKDGNKSVQEMLSSMENIEKSNNEVLDEFGGVIENLSDIVKIISDIKSKTTMINDIVFQTKLLSFNASVEAARAGELGKGFAVVAEEVGNLATASGKTATEITSLLEESETKVEAIASSTKEKIETVTSTGRSSVEAGYAKAKECTSALSEIIANVNKVNDMTNEITKASQEQVHGITGLNDSLQNINTSTSDIAQTAKVVLTNANDVEEGVNQLQLVSENLELVLRGTKKNVCSSSDNEDQSADVIHIEDGKRVS